MEIQSLCEFSIIDLRGATAYLSSFRRIVCNRHEHRGHYDVVDFVPTQAEVDALDELDMIIERKDEDDLVEGDESFLISALKVVPQVKSINIESQNPFSHSILRKVWQEYSLEAFRPQPRRESQFLKVLHAVRISGLITQHFSHDQLMSTCFADGALEREHGFTLHDDISTLKSLKLDISDHQGLFSRDGRAVIQLRELLSASPVLENLSVNFATLDSISLEFLPTTSAGTLQSLSLFSITIDPGKLLAFLEGHASTLKRLQLKFVNIPQGLGSWRGFLEDLRETFGHTLEKFQLSGMVRSVDGDGEQWLLWPRYDQDWILLENERTPKTEELENFVLKGGPWPMVADDTFPFS